TESLLPKTETMASNWCSARPSALPTALTFASNSFVYIGPPRYLRCPEGGPVVWMGHGKLIGSPHWHPATSSGPPSMEPGYSMPLLNFSSIPTVSPFILAWEARGLADVTIQVLVAREPTVCRAASAAANAVNVVVNVVLLCSARD